MIKVVELWVVYGYFNFKSVKEFIYKCGYGKVNGQCIVFIDNSIVEENFGKYGIICIEDFIYEIVIVGFNFKQVVNFFWFFKFSNFNGGFCFCKFKYFIEGGDFGNCEEYINVFICQMN